MDHIQPFDQLPGLIPEEVLTLRAMRFSEGGNLLLKLLAFHPPLRRATPESPAHNDSYLLGAREMYDSVINAWRNVGAPPPVRTEPLPKPTYPLPARKSKPAATED